MATTSNKRERRYDPTISPVNIPPELRAWLEEETTLIALGINALLDAFEVIISDIVTLGNDGTGDLVAGPERAGIWLIHADYDPASGNWDPELICTTVGTRLSAIHQGADVVVSATGSNPDTNGKVNYWANADGSISVKNRTAETFTFRAYKLGI